MNGLRTPGEVIAPVHTSFTLSCFHHLEVAVTGMDQVEIGEDVEVVSPHSVESASPVERPGEDAALGVASGQHSIATLIEERVVGIQRSLLVKPLSQVKSQS